MKSGIRLALIGIVVYLVLLVPMVPAAYVYGWLQPAELELDGIQGTLWDGSAAKVSVSEIVLKDVRWHFQPGALFTGNLEYRTKFNDGNDSGVANIARDWRGDIRIRDARLLMAAQRLDPYLQLGPVGLRGRLEVTIDDFRFGADRLSADGILVWEKAAVTMQDSIAELGELEMQVFDTEDGVQGVIEDREGPFAVNGELNFARDYSYQLSGTLQPRGPLQPELATVLRYLGPSDAQGRYFIKFSGMI